MVIVFLANGFEETEAIAPIDILRRANIDVLTAGIGGKHITSSHGITVECDIMADKIPFEQLEMVFLPGGKEGTNNLEASKDVQNCLDYATKHNLWIAAICAAPSILGHKGLLNGKNATCYPGFERQLENAIISDLSVVWDGKVITGKGAGISIDFGLKLLECLTSPQKSLEIGRQIQCQN